MSSPCIARIAIVPPKELKEIRGVDEDWTGKGDARERRKLQNRLHQRAWRRRKAEREKIQAEAWAHVHYARRTAEITGVDDAFTQAVAAIVPQPPPPTTPSETSSAALGKTTRTTHPAPDTRTPTQTSSLGPVRPTVPHHNHDHISSYQELMTSILRHTRTNPPLPTLPSKFPLAPDHYLLTLIQYNVLRAMFTNFALCSLMHTIPASCDSARLISALPQPSSPPPSFDPTPLQISTPHNRFLDSIPCPKFRDNLIVADSQGLYDDRDFCSDLCGGLWEGNNECESRGLLVWGEPWRRESWEFSPGFAGKWGWLLKGCWEMIDATNRWREARGEEALVVEELME